MLNVVILVFITFLSFLGLSSHLVVTYSGYRHVSYSTYGVTLGLCVARLFSSLINYMGNDLLSSWFIWLSLLALLIISYLWVSDILRDSYAECSHINIYHLTYCYRFIIFIISEAMFFISLGWVFVSHAVTSMHYGGSVWPSVDIVQCRPYQLALINTCILVSSGVLITISHNALCNRAKYLGYILGRVMLGICFTTLQYSEYMLAAFRISDTVFGSIFYLATGFHGLHVIIGSCFLCVVLAQSYTVPPDSYSTWLDCSIWYWHFVDIIWLVLFSVFYIILA